MCMKDKPKIKTYHFYYDVLNVSTQKKEMRKLQIMAHSVEEAKKKLKDAGYDEVYTKR